MKKNKIYGCNLTSLREVMVCKHCGVLFYLPTVILNYGSGEHDELYCPNCEKPIK
jgi:hypothetical protein